MDRKNKLTKVLIALLAVMFTAGVVLGAVEVLSAEGQMPPEAPYVESRTELPGGKEDILTYLNSAIRFATAEKAKLDVSTDISIKDDSISFGENGDMLTKSFIYAKESILSNTLKRYPPVSIDFGEDFSADLWNLGFDGALIEKAESKEDGDNYTFEIMFPDESDPFNESNIVNDSFHMKESEEVLGYLWESYRGFAAIANVRVKCTGLIIEAAVNRLSDKISRITYTKQLNVEADITFSGELAAAGTKRMTFTLEEKTGFSFTWPGLSLKPKELAMEKGDIKVVSALITASGDIKVKWTSSNPAVAEVDGDGYVKGRAVSAEPVIITAEMEFLGQTYTDTCEVYVKVPVTKVTLSDKEITLSKGETKALQAGVKPKDATVKAVLWYSVNPAVAAVDSSGNVTGVAAGKTEIYVLSKDGFYKISCAVAVTD